MPIRNEGSNDIVNPSKPKKSSKKPKTSEDELEEFGISLGGVIGQGSFSKVRSAKYKDKEVAVKVITPEKLSQNFGTKFLPREIEILSKIRHENIVKVYKIFTFPKRVYIVMELMQSDLVEYLNSRTSLTETEARDLFVQMVSAVKYLHSVTLAHRDLKCENIMIDGENRIKIIDFGFCRSAVGKNGHKKLSDTFCGSTAYAAPEVLQGQPYNPMFYDVWSLGCVLYIMIIGRVPFEGDNIKGMVRLQLKRQISFPRSLSRSLKHLIRHMLEPDLTKRYTMEHVSHSPWIKGKEEPDEDKRFRFQVRKD